MQSCTLCRLLDAFVAPCLVPICLAACTVLKPCTQSRPEHPSSHTPRPIPRRALSEVDAAIRAHIELTTGDAIIAYKAHLADHYAAVVAIENGTAPAEPLCLPGQANTFPAAWKTATETKDALAVAPLIKKETNDVVAAATAALATLAKSTLASKPATQV